jgi:AraC family transcriptional regulator, transcriptional activator of pobA
MRNKKSFLLNVQINRNQPMKYQNNLNQLFEILPLCKINIYKKLTTCNALTILWVSSGKLHLQIDGIPYMIPKNTILCVSPNQKIAIDHCEEGQYLVQYNQDFYCIIQHDKEVSCAGLLFFSPYQNVLLSVDEHWSGRINLLLNILEEEFTKKDSLQGEMLRVLLKRLIITCTRIAKQQLFSTQFELSELDLFRHFSMLVEQHFKKQHNVDFYAKLLYKAPKTLSNQFALLKIQSPSEIIHQIIILEAKRLLIYTPMSCSEIAFQLGFEELAHFSRFFKNKTNINPSEFYKNGFVIEYRENSVNSKAFSTSN